MNEAIDCLRSIPNPFAGKIVDSPWAEIVDVPSIHARESDRLLALFREVAEDGGTRNALLLAAAGAGKTHLLARLARRIADDGLFVHVEPYFEPRRVARAVLRHVVESLLRPAPDVPYPQLTRLCHAALTGVLGRVREEARGTDRQEVETWLSVLGDEPARVFALMTERGGPVARRVLDYLQARHPSLDPVFVDVLLRCFRRTTNADRTINLVAARWAKGEDLSEEELASLGVSTSLGEDEERAMRALETLGLLSRWHRPFLLTFDQLETLRSGEDLDPLVELGKVLTNLRTLPNFLVLVSMLPEKWQELNDVRGLPGSTRDRFEEVLCRLRSLSKDDARAIVARRVQERVLPRCPGLDAKEGWPFSEAFYASLGARSVSAREALRQCASVWEESAGAVAPPWGPLDAPHAPEAPIALLRRCFETKLGELARQAEEPVADEDAFHRILLDVLRLAWDAQGGQWEATLARHKNRHPYLHLKGAGAHQVLLTVLSGAHPRTFQTRLSTLRQVARKAGARRILVLRPPSLRDRKPGEAGAELQSQIEADGGGLHFPSIESQRRIRALRDVMAAIDAGEVGEEGSRVSRADLVKCLGELRPLDGVELLDLLHRAEPEAVASSAPSLDAALMALVGKQKILSRDQAARELTEGGAVGATRDEIMASAARLQTEGRIAIQASENPVFRLLPSRPRKSRG